MFFGHFFTRTLQLANRMVMAPLTRSRAPRKHLPNAWVATCDAQRATAGLVVTDGISPSANGRLYPHLPRLYNVAQAHARQTTTTAVHTLGGKIFVQFMHRHRAAQVANLPAGAEVPERASPCARVGCSPTRWACSRTARRAR